MTPVEVRILEALSAFRFLTVEQMQRLNVGQDRKHLGERLRALAGQGLIGVLAWGVYPGLGRLPRMYHLKAKGAQTLAAFLRIDVAEVPFVPGAPKFEMDHLHRRSTVDCHIALTLWAAQSGRKIEGFQAYYFQKPLRLRLNGTQTLAPDAVFDLSRADGSPVLTVLEVCMDRSGTDRSRIIRQMESHRIAMESGALAEALGIKRGNRLMAVFENRASLEAVRDRLRVQTAFSGFTKLFLFADLDAVRNDFGSAWEDLSGAAVSL
ncbi:hypothetical protein [Roseibium aggregatum]|uniref:Uncharacterized protein n=1 Tax=Roseibium aggregatum TaxID=187304 RepID=A0A926P3P7_9HYPH|nr:hypothetical protein [Roseibium aggregatum]MBD1549600.1 hypothetical protein [Roseibium aggregatum]